MKLHRAAEASAWLATASLLVATVVWPGWSIPSARENAQAASKAMLKRLAARERQILAQRGWFLQFGPSGAERSEVLGGADLGRNANLFDVDASLDEAGHLHLRVVSRPDSIRRGDIAPVLEQVELEPTLPASSS